MDRKNIRASKKESGITLIALVVTIIILLILAFITFRTLLGENGTIGKAIEGTSNWKEAESKENAFFDSFGNVVNEFVNGKENNIETEENIEYWDGTIADSFSGGDGSLANPYQISNGKELARFAYLVNNPTFDEDWGIEIIHGVLVKNIYLNKTDNWVYSWTPIGNSYGFYGNFNGNNHFISGLFMSMTTGGPFGGLFTSNYGNIENLGIINSYSDVHMGGMIAAHNFGSIKNCYNKGKIQARSNYGTGGIAGNNGGLIENCYNTGEVVASEAYTRSGCAHAGIVGRNDINGIIRNCYNSGNIISTMSGYISGITSNNDGIIDGCYNSGNLIGRGESAMIGGLVAYNNRNIKKLLQFR